MSGRSLLRARALLMVRDGLDLVSGASPDPVQAISWLKQWEDLMPTAVNLPLAELGEDISENVSVLSGKITSVVAERITALMASGVPLTCAKPVSAEAVTAWLCQAVQLLRPTFACEQRIGTERPRLQLRLLSSVATAMLGDFDGSVELVAEWLDMEDGAVGHTPPLSTPASALKLGVQLRNQVSKRLGIERDLLVAVCLQWAERLQRAGRWVELRMMIGGFMRCHDRPPTVDGTLLDLLPDIRDQARLLAYYLYGLEELHPHAAPTARRILELLEAGTTASAEPDTFQRETSGIRWVAARGLLRRAWLLGDVNSWDVALRAVTPAWITARIAGKHLSQQALPGERSYPINYESPMSLPDVDIVPVLRSSGAYYCTPKWAACPGNSAGDPNSMRRAAIPRGCVWLGFTKVGRVELGNEYVVPGGQPLAYVFHHRPDGEICSLFRPGMVAPGPGDDKTLASAIRRFDRSQGELWKGLPVPRSDGEEMNIFGNAVNVQAEELEWLRRAYEVRLGPVLECLFSRDGIDWEQTDLIIDDHCFPACPWDMLAVAGSQLLDLCRSTSSAVAMGLWEVVQATPARRRESKISCAGHFPVNGIEPSPFECYLGSRLQDICREAKLRLRALWGNDATVATVSELFGQPAAVAVVLAHGSDATHGGGVTVGNGQVNWIRSLASIDLVVLVSCLVGRGLHRDSAFSHPYGPLLDLYAAGATQVMGFRSDVSAKHASEFVARVLRVYLADANHQTMGLARARTLVMRQLCRSSRSLASRKSGKQLFLAEPTDLSHVNLAMLQFVAVMSGVFGPSRPWRES
jgi:hypothetical protein